MWPLGLRVVGLCDILKVSYRYFARVSSDTRQVSTRYWRARKSSLPSSCTSSWQLTFLLQINSSASQKWCQLKDRLLKTAQVKGYLELHRGEASVCQYRHSHANVTPEKVSILESERAATPATPGEMSGPYQMAAGAAGQPYCASWQCEICLRTVHIVRTISASKKKKILERGFRFHLV